MLHDNDLRSKLVLVVLLSTVTPDALIRRRLKAPVTGVLDMCKASDREKHDFDKNPRQ